MRRRSPVLSARPGRSDPWGSVRDQRVQVDALQALAAAEERQLEDEARADDLAAELLYETANRLDRAARREHVVVDDDPGAGCDQVGVQLEDIDCGGVYLADVATGELHLEAHRGLPDAVVSRVSHYKADSLEVRLVKGGQTFYVGEEQIPRSLEVLWGSHGLRALAVAPVQHQGALLGLLILGSWRQSEIPRRTRVGIELLASQVSGIGCLSRYSSC